jgi:AraC family transcriptional activator FtrA
MAVVVSPQASLFEFGAVMEIFGCDPGIGVPWYRVGVFSASPPPVPTSLDGVSINSVRPLASLRQADWVMVMPPSTAGPETLDGLRRLHRRGARVAAVCTGAFVLAATGLLDGRRATTHWERAPELAARFPRVDVDPGVLYIDDGDVLTSAGSAAGIDLCLHIVRADYGAEAANQVARSLVVPPHRAGGQAQFVSRAIPEVEPDDPFAHTLEWMDANLSEAITVDALAARSAMSPRTFARRFREGTGATPHQWLLNRRILLAQRLLETTGLPVDEVARQCGLGSPTNFRLHFQRVVGTNPTSYRRTFHADGPGVPTRVATGIPA